MTSLYWHKTCTGDTPTSECWCLWDTEPSRLRASTADQLSGYWLRSHLISPTTGSTNISPKCPNGSQVLGTQKWTERIFLPLREAEHVLKLSPDRPPGSPASGPQSLQSNSAGRSGYSLPRVLEAGLEGGAYPGLSGPGGNFTLPVSEGPHASFPCPSVPWAGGGKPRIHHHTENRGCLQRGNM